MREITMDTLSSYLTDDHERCDALMRYVGKSIGEGQWLQARHAMAAFHDALERHLLIEERILFAAFEEALGRAASPTAAMRSEHLRIRAVLQRMSESVKERDGRAFGIHAEVLLLVLHQHSEKEEGVLYPMIERVLARRSQDVLARMRAFGVHECMA